MSNPGKECTGTCRRSFSCPSHLRSDATIITGCREVSDVSEVSDAICSSLNDMRVSSLKLSSLKVCDDVSGEPRDCEWFR